MPHTHPSHELATRKDQIINLFLACIVFICLGLITIYIARDLERDPDKTLEIRVLKTELDKARKDCHTDTALLFDSKGRYYVVPCSVIKESGK